MARASHRFFFGRQEPDLGLGGGRQAPFEYLNLPIHHAILISRGIATLHELDTIYGTEDVYNLLEIVMVDNANTEWFRTHKD